MIIKKKKRLLLLLLISLFFSLAFFPLALAAVNETEQVNLAYSWLSEQAKEWPSGAENAAFALLALSYDDALAGKGKNALIDSSKDEEGICWPSTCKVKETALSLLALHRIGYDTTNIEEWLLAQNSTPTGMKWYLQIDSKEACNCTISYDEKEYKIKIGENKKIDKSAGSCLSKSYNDYFLKVPSGCQEKTFTIICDKDFLVSFLYEKSGTYYVSSKTEHESAYGSIEAKINALCLGTTGCDYEGTLWAAFALQQADYETNQFLPYLISDADNKKKYLPEAFLYLITAQEDYASQLFEKQKMSGYWLAPNTAHDKYYDTALAFLALQSYENENVTRAKEWLLKQQDKDGKWNNLKDTAFILYAVWPKEPSYRPVEIEGKECREHGGECVYGYDCGEGEWLDEHDDCAIDYICCEEAEEPIPEATCAEMGGIICEVDEECETREIRAKDTDHCCLAECEKIEEEEEWECEEKDYTCEYGGCERGEREVDYACPGGYMCCAPARSKAWIWWLIILLLIAGGVLFFLYKKGKLKNIKFRRKPRRPPGAPKYPPGYRPGMPPGRPMLRPKPGMPMTKPRLAIPPSAIVPRRPLARLVRRPARGKTEAELEETVKKLKKISGEK